MILHQQLLQPEHGPREPWLAVHVESLTIAHCEDQGGTIRIHALKDGTEDFPFSNTQKGNPIAFAMMIEDDIAQHLGIRSSIHPLPASHPALGTLPDYLLLNSLDGTTPAILHTVDPVAIYFAQDERGTLGHAEHFRSSTDLSAEGWAYWWEDAQRAFHKLTIEFFAGAGMEVPAHITAAVKHD